MGILDELATDVGNFVSSVLGTGKRGGHAGKRGKRGGKPLPIIEDWTMQETLDGPRVTLVGGLVYGMPKVKDGTPILTGRIVSKVEDLVTSSRGEQFLLGERGELPRSPSTGYAIVFTEAPLEILRPGQVFYTGAALGDALRKAAKYLRDEDPDGYPRMNYWMDYSGKKPVKRRSKEPAGFLYYKTELERLADGERERIDIHQEDADRVDLDWVAGFSEADDLLNPSHHLGRRLPRRAD